MSNHARLLIKALKQNKVKFGHTDTQLLGRAPRSQPLLFKFYLYLILYLARRLLHALNQIKVKFDYLAFEYQYGKVMFCFDLEQLLVDAHVILSVK